MGCQFLMETYQVSYYEKHYNKSRIGGLYVGCKRYVRFLGEGKYLKKLGTQNNKNNNIPRFMGL